MGTEILRCAQDDTGWPIRLSSPEEPMVQYVRINELRPRTGIASPGGRNELRPYNFASCLTQKNLKPSFMKLSMRKVYVIYSLPPGKGSSDS